MPQMEFGSLTDTLKDEVERIKRGREKGLHCRACEQFAKVYPRQIHSTMARAMIYIYRKFKDNWFHITEVDKLITNARSDFHKIAHWGLIEPMPVLPAPKSASPSVGMWRFTDKGMEFIRNEIKVPIKAYIYNDQVLEFGTDYIDIMGCLKNKFNYWELMNEG